jgi:hypothetical protein
MKISANGGRGSLLDRPQTPQVLFVKNFTSYQMPPQNVVFSIASAKISDRPNGEASGALHPLANLPQR